MAAIFAATHAVPDTAVVRLLRRMAEAGMIGGGLFSLSMLPG